MSDALRNLSVKSTSQMERTPGVNEIKNNAGGFVFEVNDKTRLERFLILGTDGGTYYVGERDLTNQNFDFLRKLIDKDVRLVIDTAVAVSESGRAPKNSPALFVVAAALTFCKPEEKAYVRAAVNRVARTATHLFEFAQYIENLGGWGRAKRQAVAEWYETKDADKLAYQAVKYRQRNGWTHRDLLRLSHAKPNDRVARFMLGKPQDTVLDPISTATDILYGFDLMQRSKNVDEVLQALNKNPNLPWETIPTQFLKDARIWKHLFYNGQLKGQALLRNVVRLAKLEAFNDLKFAVDYAERLADAEQIKRGRVHPIAYLNALVTYNEGQTRTTDGWGYVYRQRTPRSWEISSQIKDALDAGFYAAFGAIEPAGKRYLIGQDISGSMASMANGIDLTCSQAGAAFSMAVARTEKYHMIRGFNTQFTDLGISANTSLAEAMNAVKSRTFGGTDCALPMVWAQKNKVEIDTFVVVTDNETWAGGIKPFQALRNYRQAMGIPAKLVVVGMTATECSIADPSDAGMLDVVGFDASAPNVITDFSR